MDIFNECHAINDLLINQQEKDARNKLIKLLDYHEQEDISYTPLVNHLIRETGLYPYLDIESANWRERMLHEAFKVNIGNENHVTLHREQSGLLKKLIDGESIAVSAPTSFGKSFVIDAYISIRKPTNVVIIVPTIALTDETRRRLYKKFSSEYKIITTADVQPGNKNIFIFPQERAINYVDKISEIDILIIDEFYKASTKFEKERSPTLIRAILDLGKISKQRYFLAPNISSLQENQFTEGMEFYPLDFNTVYLEQHKLYESIKNDEEKGSVLLEMLRVKSTKSLIYAGTYANIERVSTLLLTNTEKLDRTLLVDFSKWLGENYDYNWGLTSLVQRGTGVHNGRLHRSLSQIQVKLFEEIDGLDNIISTSSIIEGVNTSAENVFIWANRTGRARLNDFTYKNIMGRGGRMFKHFVGKIYILDEPPIEENTQLDIPFPDQILGSIDEVKHKKDLTQDQLAKIILQNDEMSKYLGEGVFERIKSEQVFQTSDYDLIKKIAEDMHRNPDDWNGLGYLNSSDEKEWNRMLHKIVPFSPNWECSYTQFVEFTKTLRNNWFKSIPELLKELEVHNLGIDDFFKLERKVTFKLSSLVADINILQKEILKHKNYDISTFVSRTSHAFLPPVVYQLEEFGLPRMISKKVHKAGLIDFYNKDLNIHSCLNQFNEYGFDTLKVLIELDRFDEYILRYFYDGITINEN